MVIVNMGGNGADGGGASKVTRDVTNIIGQLPPVMEALTGMKLEDLIERVPGIRTEQPEDAAAREFVISSKPQATAKGKAEEDKESGKGEQA